MENSALPNIREPSEVPAKKKSILVIDDSSDMLNLQRTVLELEGFEVFTAQSGTEAFKVLSEVDKPALILLDVRMEDMSGPDFLSLLEKKQPEITDAVPVVFLTAMDQIPKGKVAGFIRKPFLMDKFLEAVHGFIELGQTSPCYH